MIFMKKDKRFSELIPLDKDCEKLRNLVGKRIIDVGFLKDVCEGGLAIDYEEKGKLRRTIVGFTELGMWVHWGGEIGILSEDDVLFEKLTDFCSNFDFDFGKTTLKENAKKLEYTIVGNVSLTLTIKEIKLLSQRHPCLIKEFGKKDKGLQRIVAELNDCAFGQDTCL